MAFDRSYGIDQIEESFTLEDLEGAEWAEDGYQIDEVFIPEERVPTYDGVNSTDMELCRMEDGEWAFTKPVDANYGRADKANVMVSLMYDRLGVPAPNIGIDEEVIFIEHLGPLDDPRGMDDVDTDAIERAIAGKAIAGDSDIAGNIGINGKCYVYDFDQAGGPIRKRVEGEIADFVNQIDSYSADLSLEDLNREITSMAQGLDLDDYRAELENVLDEHLPGEYGLFFPSYRDIIYIWYL